MQVYSLTALPVYLPVYLPIRPGLLLLLIVHQTPGTQPCGLDVQQETVESKSPYPH
ncbi:hypothetical protein HBI32_138440 [Parastagonospora nodorum]|nr:hypothetical protein HBI32_138440 [Parastagonospora nodorum]